MVTSADLEIGDTAGSEACDTQLHRLGDFDAEDFQALLEDFGGHFAQGEASGALGTFGFEHGAILVEAREVAGQIVEICAEKIRAVILGDGFEDQAEVQQVFGQSEFFGSAERDFAAATGVIEIAFAENTADAGVGVLQIRRGVALERQHLVPTEDVIALAILGEVGVFDGAEADDPRDFEARFFGHVGVFFADDFEGAFFGFVEQVLEFDGVARAGFERFAVFTEDRAEPDVGQFDAGFRMPFAESGEDLAKVQLLATVGDVNDFVRLRAPRAAFHAELQGGEVGRGVIETGVALLHERGMFFQIGNIIKRDDERAFALAGETAFFQVFDDVFEAWIVIALAVGVIEFDAEPVIDAFELRFGERDHIAPNLQVLLVAALELDEFLARFVEHGRILFAGGVDQFIEALHFADGVLFERGFVEVLFPADEQFAELRAPIADVVVGHDAMAEQTQDAREGIAKNGRANVTDVHRLGDIGRTEIDHDRARLGRLLEKQVFAAKRANECFADGGWFEGEIEKAGAGDLDFVAPLGDVELGFDVGGQLARVHLALFGERHESVALVIAELGVRCRAHENAGDIRVRENGANGFLQFLFEKDV